MATKKMTQAQALAHALTLLNYANITAIQIEGHEVDWTEVGDVLGNILAQKTKKPAHKAESVAHRQNREMLGKLVDKLEENEVITTKQIAEMFGLASAQKAVAITNMGVDETHVLERVYKGKKLVGYKLA